MKTLLLTALISLLAFPTGRAGATIPNFEFVGITGRGSLSGNLSTRLGTSVGSTEHIVNVDDCETYLDGEVLVTVRITTLPTGNWQYALAYAPSGKTCVTTSANPTDTADTCLVVAAQRELTTSTLEFVVNMSDLMGSACDSNVEGTARLYVILENPTLTTVNSETIDVLVDLKPPVTPTLDSATGGDKRFVVGWTDANNVSESTTYDVFWDDIDFGDADLENVESQTNISTTTYAVETSNIVNGTTYYVGVVAVDDADNRSALSNRLSVIPEETVDFWEGYVSAGGTDPGAFCFVATAAWGSPLEGSLDTLRAFRNDILLATPAGRSLVEGYYLYGRFAAAWIADKPMIRAVVRAVLTPLVWLAWLTLEFGPAGPLGALLLSIAAFAAMRRMIQKRFDFQLQKGLV